MRQFGTGPFPVFLGHQPNNGSASTY
jgi:hypothetical protein